MRRLIIVMTLVVLMLTACQNTEERTIRPIKIDAETAKDMMEDDVLIVDVRTQEEYAQGHVPEAMLLPVDIIRAGDLSLLPDKDQMILLYCRSGNRSGQAAKVLVEEGYTQVYDFGGIIDWPYDIVK